MLEVKKSIFDDAIIHLFPDSPYIVKACLNLRRDRKVWVSIPMKDLSAILSYMARHDDISCLPYRIITHRGE